MLNLIKMELFRLFKNKNTYITLLFVIFFGVLLFAMSATMGEASEAGNIQENNVMYTEISSEQASAIKSGSQGVGFVASEFTSETPATLELVVKNFLSSGVFLIFIGIFATNMVCGKYKSGFHKNLGIYSDKKWQMILAENLPLLVFAVMEMLLIVIIYLICGAIYFNDFTMGSLVNMIRYLGMQILMHYAFATFIMCLAEIIRGKVIGITITCMLSMGFGTLITSKLDDLIGWEKFSITEHMIEYNVKLLPSKFDGDALGTAIIVVIFAVIVYNVISSAVVSNRDMA